jgi:hypothetical protein
LPLLPGLLQQIFKYVYSIFKKKECVFEETYPLRNLIERRSEIVRRKESERTKFQRLREKTHIPDGATQSQREFIENTVKECIT